MGQQYIIDKIGYIQIKQFRFGYEGQCESGNKDETIVKILRRAGLDDNIDIDKMYAFEVSKIENKQINTFHKLIIAIKLFIQLRQGSGVEYIVIKNIQVVDPQNNIKIIELQYKQYDRSIWANLFRQNAPGIIPCIFRDIFNPLYLGQYRYVYRISYTQIYNQKLIDLLNNNINQTKQLKIGKDNDWGNEISGAVKIQVNNFEQCLQILDKGQDNRKYGQKINHDRSSRSHTILKIYIQKWDTQLQCSRSAINVVDLAGSERLSATDTGNAQTGHINKSLFQFSNVISKLSQNSSQHIPYRNSKLTRLLQTSLTTNSNLAIIFCISPAVVNFMESVSTLRLACKAKKVQIANQQTEHTHTTNINKLQQIIKQKDIEIKKLKDKISKLNKEVAKLEEHNIMRQNKQNKQYHRQHNRQYNRQHNRQHNKNVCNMKVLVILDHQNMMLSIDEMVHDIQQQQISGIKSEMMDKLAELYEQYAQKIARIGIGLGYQQSWLKMEDICFVNLFYDRNTMLQYRIPLIRQACDNLDQNQSAFAQALKMYINKMEQHIQSQSHTHTHTDRYGSNRLNHNHNYNYNSSNKQKLQSPKYCNQSPIFEQSTIQVTDSSQICGGKVVAWGCKKDNRVFKTPNNTILAQCNTIGNITALACGAHHTLAVNQQGMVYGWGKNQHKQISNHKYITIPNPILILTPNIKIKQVAAGWGHTLLLSQQGHAYSYGYGQDGQLGHGQYKNVAQPKRIQLQNRVSAIYAGHSHSGLIDNQHNYYAFGFNKDYRLMIAQQKQVNRPTRINIKGVVKAALGVTHTCLLTKHGRVYCGGVGTNGQLGTQLTPQITGYDTVIVPQKNFEQNSIQKTCPILQIQYFTNNNIKVINISCGECSTAIVTQSHQLYTFGKTTFNRLGHTQSNIVKILDNVDRVSMGYRHGFAWNSKNKQVYGWGFNMYNQLGTLQPKDIKKPQLIHTISTKDVLHITTGFFHSVAICK